MAAAWTRKATAGAKALASCVPGAIRDVDDDKQRIPKGYLPLVLVRDDDDNDDDNHHQQGGSETRVLVRVRDLKEPCMAALLEMAEQQFGYGQQGVLRVPCDAQRFDHVITMARKSKAC